MDSLVRLAEADSWIALRSVEAERRDLFLHFEVWPDSGEAPDGWLVACTQVRECSLTQFDGGGLNYWHRDHPLLLQFSSSKASLRAAPGELNRAQFLGVLLASHREAVDDWIPFERFLAPAVWSVDDRSQVVAAGPAFLLAEYHRSLIQAGFSADLKVHKRPLYWSGFGWSQERCDVAMLHFGSSFVVAQQFTAMPDPHAFNDGTARRER